MNWIAEILENHVAQRPNHAFLFDEQTPEGLTFQQIYDLSGRVYAYLKSKNIGKEDFVLINLPRGIKPFVALLGTWRSGSAFTIVENTDPIDRIKYIYDNCSCKLEINEKIWAEILKTEPLNGYEEVDEHDASYAVYTSGTTGNPKGVLHEYGNLKEIYESHFYQKEFIFKSNDKIVFIASLSAIPPIIDFHHALTILESEFHVISRDTAKNQSLFQSYLLDKKITTMFITPSYFKSSTIELSPSIRTVILIAEPANGITPLKGANIYISYAMSESGFAVSLFKIDKKYDICPIGQPQFNKKVYILDENNNEVADGEVGEFCFENPFVRGYINLPEENKRAFQNGIYHTNDLAKKLPDGNYVIIGRKNDMIKINGNRVEPAEVEAVIRNVLNIDWCGVKGFENNESAYLVAYYTADLPNLDISEVRKKLAQKLPYYMLPAQFVKIDKIPVNRNGKFDRKSLPAPKFKAEEIILPETEFEKQVFDVVSKELGITEFGVTTNLISMGLTSIKAIKISALIKKETDISIKTTDILAHPFIREWENFVETEEDKIEVLPIQKTYPLTANQLGIYIDWERNREGLQYNIPFAVKLKQVEPKKLLNALNKVIETHPYFKVHINVNEKGEIVQERRDEANLSVVFKRLETEPTKEFFQSRVKPFDLLKDDLSRFEVYYTEKSIYLFFDIHHILFDGTSANLFLSDIFEAYEEKNLTAEQVTAYDYSLYLQKWTSSESYKKSEKYFDELIVGTESFMYPAFDSQAQATGKSEFYQGKISKKQIQDYCLKLGVTVNAFFATVLCQVFHRISREEQIQISTISSGRSLDQLSNSVGMFVQTLPLVSKNTKGKTLDLLKSMQEQIISTLKNDKYPFTNLVEKYGIKPNVLYAYQGDVLNEENTSKFERISLDLNTVITPISINVWPQKDVYHLDFEYDEGLYTNEEIEKLSNAISNFAMNLAQSSEIEIQNIPVVSDQEAKDLITLGTGEKLEYDQTKTVVDLFQGHVKNQPNNLAVVDYRSSITYTELDRQSNIIADMLIKKGIKANDFVAVKLSRIKEFMVSVLGIWKAGGAYVPVDPEYPADRIAYMIEDAGAKVVIDEKFLSQIDWNQETKSINLTTPNNLAYMIYTSGSTGKPKGVMVSQANLRAFTFWLSKKLELKSGEAVAEYSSFSFDGSCIDLYPILTVGGAVHILSSELRQDMTAMVDYFKSNSIKECFFTTTFAQIFLNNGETELEYLIMGGEKNTGFKPSVKTKVIDVYGPTEATSVITTKLIDQIFPDISNIPIGRPVPNTISAIVDKKGNLLPRSMSGELVLIGPQVSKGYCNRPKLTKEKFVDCPFIQGQKMYKTGDLVRWNENNELLFIGRIDNQIKLRGFRIELGEVETTLSKIAGIKSAVAEVKDINGTQHLIGYYVADQELDSNLLKQELSKTLTEYMVPDLFVCLDQMPLTPNGKVNRKALPLPELKAEEIVLPETEFEKQVFDVVSKELGITEFGVTTNLISMGMTSIKAIKVSALIKKVTDISVKTTDILAHPFIREWNNFVETEEDKIEILPVQKTYPLTANQLGIYIDWERNREGLQYNIPNVLKLNNDKPKKFLDNFNKFVELHPYFKVHLKTDKSGEIVQERRDEEQLSIVFEKINFEPDKDFFQQRVKPFNLLDDDLSRFEIYYTDKNVYLFMDVHHILFDGTSINILLSELLKSYNGQDLDQELATAYDYSLYLQKWTNSESYKKSEKYFDELIVGTESFMYPAFDSQAQATGKSETYICEVSKHVIKEYCSKNGITENAFFATVLCQVFHRISREEQIQIATISSGRSLEQLSNTIGMFVQTLPLVSKKSKGKTLDLLKSMQEQIISTLKNDKYPFTNLVEKYGIKPNVLYTYQGDVISKDNSSKFEQIQLELDTVKTPISINIMPKENNYALSFEYDNGLYTKEEMERLSDSISNFATNITKQEIDTPIETISLISEEEQQELITLGTGKKLEYDKTKTFMDLFLEQVRINPTITAVVDYKSSITYAELDRQSNIVANILIEKGIKPNDFIAVKLPRIKEFLVLVIGIWKIGATYVPIDLNYPIERMNYVIEDSQSKIVIDEEFLTGIDFNQEAKPIKLTTSENLAYIIYTSGSTGKPKGIMVAHSSLMAFITWMSLELKLKPGLNIAEYASFSFDVSVTEFYTSLSTGATVHIFGDNILKDFEGILKYIKENKIVSSTFSTQLGIELLNTSNPELEYILLGGEKLKLANNQNKPNRKIYNIYGPTEVSVWSTFHIVNFEKDKDNIPIGRPAPNLIVAVVDKQNNIIPRGMTGELIIIGEQTSKGYLHRPDLTKEKFVDCPFIQGQKMYKTGDLVRWNEDGELIFLGRIDFQVKLRGFRIELGEVETTLSKVAEIKSAVAEVKEVNGTQHLIGYYVADQELDSNILKQELSKTLTEYMVPDLFVRLDQMPLTPNGKVNRKALPIPELKAEAVVLPKNIKETTLLNIVQKILGTKDIGVTNDLIKAGLTSIQVIKLVAMAKKEKCIIKADDVFKLRTIRNIASITKIIGEWYNEFDHNKPVMIFVAGSVPFIHLKPLIEKISKIYNCFLFESILDYYDYIFKGETIDDVVLFYSNLFEDKLPTGCKVDVFAGYCFGGEIAIRMANKYTEEHNEYPTLFLWETYFEEQLQPIPQKEIEKLLKALPKNILEDTKEKIKAAEVRYSLLKNNTIQTYNGECVYFEATKEYVDNLINISNPEGFEKTRNCNKNLIKKHIPNIKIIYVDADHLTILKNTSSTDLAL